MRVDNLPDVSKIMDEFVTIKYPLGAILGTMVNDLGQSSRRIGHLECSRDRLKYNSPAYLMFQVCIDEYWKAHFIISKRIFDWRKC